MAVAILVALGSVGAVATVVGALDRGDADSATSSAVRSPAPTSSTRPPSTTIPATLPPTTATPPRIEPTPAPPPGCTPVSDLSVDQQAHLVVMVGIDGASIGPAELLVVGPAPVGGLFVGGDPTQILADGSLADLVSRTRVIVAVDDEGGRVQRLDGLVGELPSAAEMGALPVEEVRALAAERGRQLRQRGVTVDFAPVVDLSEAAGGGVIGDRSFGTDPASVIERAGAFAAGLRDAGVIPTFKHFPGHGAGRGDSHRGPVSTDPLVELERRDLVPYRELAGPGAAASWVMMGHLDVPGLTEPGVPASLSPAAHRYLREVIGFDGLVVTDELGGMDAVRSRYGVGESAVRALAAGADIVLFADVADVVPAVESIVASVLDGSIPPGRLAEAVGRVREAQGC